jgi:hypothetical protein
MQTGLLVLDLLEEELPAREPDSALVWRQA